MRFGIDWLSLGSWIALATLGGLAIYHGVAGYYHLRYYVLRRGEAESWKCQPKRFLAPELARRAVALGSANMVLGGVTTGIVLYAIERGLPVPIYFDVAARGWAYTLASTVGYFIVLDAFAYYIHRALHHEMLYKRFHFSHHRFVATTPYVTTAIHPAVFMTLQVASFLPVFVVPLHAVSVAAVLVYVLVFNIIDHSGVSLRSRIPWQAASNYHDDHHALFHVNFGQHLMLWDRLHGTLRRRGRRYGKEVFGGRGAAESGATSPPSEFWRY